jgi:tRNA threonylcarbamoyl adenosine modification protein YeaZ
MSSLHSPQYALALHTTTPQLGIAIDNFAGNKRDRVWDLGRDLSSRLHQYLQEIIQPQTWQDLKFIAVAKGPGGFTGTRIGVVTARTLAQQLNIPLFGISTLAAIAAYSAKSNTSTLIAVQMPARREELFVGIYLLQENGDLAIYLPDTLMTQAKWQETLASLDVPYQLIYAEEALAKTVTQVLELANQEWEQQKFSQWQDILPFYGQQPV